MKSSRRERSYRVDYEDDQPSYNQLKQMRERKKYRNFENALRSKNVSAIMEYDNDDDYDYEEEYDYDYR